ncbi:hypothetical protein Tco_1013632 [Tanacetum coccineum]
MDCSLSYTVEEIKAYVHKQCDEDDATHHEAIIDRNKGPGRVTSRSIAQDVMKRVAKTIGLLDDIAKINDPTNESCCLFLLVRLALGLYEDIYETYRESVSLVLNIDNNVCGDTLIRHLFSIRDFRSYGFETGSLVYYWNDQHTPGFCFFIAVLGLLLLQWVLDTVWDHNLLRGLDDEDHDLGDQNIKHCKRKICDGHLTTKVRVLSSFVVTPYSDATFEDLKTKHPFQPAPSLPHIPLNHTSSHLRSIFGF